MNCPACHVENPTVAVTCFACGASLKSEPAESASAPPRQSERRSGSRRRGPADEGESAAAGEVTDPATLRAYRVALLSLVPGLGLLLGPAAVVLGLLAARRVPEDIASRNRAKVAVLCGAVVALTQWIGFVLMIW
jgi:hypothetical protein